MNLLRGSRGDRATAVAVLGLAGTAAYFGFLNHAVQSWTYDSWMVVVLVPLLLLVGAALIKVVTRNDVNPLTALMIAALVLKLAASFVRYIVTFTIYGFGDANRYHDAGAAIANAFHDGQTDVFDVLTLRQGTFFIEDLTGLLYSLMGPSRIGGFVVYSFAGFWGLVLFHRAARIGLPELDERRYAYLVYFMPTLLFWPSSVGKEAVMLLALGLSSYGVARVLAKQPHGLLPLAAGLGMAYMVRPHVVFVVLVAFTVALLFRRGPRTARPSLGPVGRLLAVVVLAAASSFMLGQAIDELIPVRDSEGVEAVGELLDRAESGTASGGSAIERQTPNSPLEYPQAVFSVLFRPTIFEAESLGTAIAAAETSLALILAITSWRRLKRLPLIMLRRPYVLFCVVYTGIFAFAWSSFANLGALVRQRVQVWPFVLLLVALPLAAPRRSEQTKPVFSRAPERRQPTSTR